MRLMTTSCHKTSPSFHPGKPFGWARGGRGGTAFGCGLGDSRRALAGAFGAAGGSRRGGRDGTAARPSGGGAGRAWTGSTGFVSGVVGGSCSGVAGVTVATAGDSRVSRLGAGSSGMSQKPRAVTAPSASSAARARRIASRGPPAAGSPDHCHPTMRWTPWCLGCAVGAKRQGHTMGRSLPPTARLDESSLCCTMSHPMTHPFFRLTLGFACLLALRAPGADWTEFRGPTGQGLSTETGLPVEWSPTKNVAWKVPLPGSGWSSPIVFQGRVYCTAAVPVNGRPGDLSLRALCLDAASGKTLWDREVFRQDASRATRIHSKNSHASPTPLTDGERLYVHFGHQGTACLDLEGKVLWTNRTLTYSPVHGNGGSPILVDDLLVF